MSYRVAINGYGRIGQSVLRALYESGYRHDIQVVAINELASLETIAYLTRYDTTHGRFQGTVETRDDCLIVNGDVIQVSHQPDPGLLPWGELEVDLVLECTGSFSDRATAEKHLHSGARRVLFSQPAEADVDATIVYGINESVLSAQQRVVSAASCTTNCIVPVLKVVHEQLGIERGVMTTVHSVMNDQPVIDGYRHQDLRRTRSALQSIIPVNTGLARGIERLLPELSGKLEANALRVPVINVSLIDLSVCVARDTDTEEVNRLLQEASQLQFPGLMGYTEEPLASCDFNHDARSSIIDGSQTKVSGKRLIKLVVWFDNEWSFANRMLDVARTWLHRCGPASGSAS